MRLVATDAASKQTHCAVDCSVTLCMSTAYNTFCVLNSDNTFCVLMTINTFCVLRTDNTLCLLRSDNTFCVLRADNAEQLLYFRQIRRDSWPRLPPASEPTALPAAPGRFSWISKGGVHGFN